jgi:RHS repeat-associated protein
MDDKSRIAIVHHWTLDDNTREIDNASDIGKNKIRYQYGNHLGSASLELDNSGDIISYEEYFPYGGTSFMAGKNQKEVKLKEYRYTGKERDDCTGLYYYGARYYAPWLVRWLSADPAGPVDGLNLYVYVSGNPVRLNDQSGMQSNDVMVFTPEEVFTDADYVDYLYEQEFGVSQIEPEAKQKTQKNTRKNTMNGNGKLKKKRKGVESRHTYEASLGVSATVLLGQASANVRIAVDEEGNLGVKVSASLGGNAEIWASSKNASIGYTNCPKVEDSLNAETVSVGGQIEIPYSERGIGYENVQYELEGETTVWGHFLTTSSDLEILPESTENIPNDLPKLPDNPNPLPVDASTTQVEFALEPVVFNVPEVGEEMINTVEQYLLIFSDYEDVQ